MLVMGAALIGVTVALPPAAEGSDLLILAYGAAIGAAGVVVLVRHRVSEPTLGAVVALGTAVITLATLEAGGGRGAEDNEVVYLWVSLYAFWFFRLRHALLQLALIGIGDAVLLLDQSPELAAGITRWVVAMATFLVTGLLAAWLHRSLERERQETARLAVVAERMRIARELHDSAGHGVTAVSLQAAAGLRALDSNPEATREALEEIKRTSRVTLEDMRRLLGALRPGETPAEALNRVSLAGLDELVGECSRAGLEVDVQVTGKPKAVPEALDQAAYRIVQEALTNVLRHAGEGARAILRLSYGVDELALEVIDDGEADLQGAPGNGKGLAGMRERVAIFDGDFQAGPVGERGFRVYARLPIPSSVAGETVEA
jgi:signal transduction histidine kinase